MTDMGALSARLEYLAEADALKSIPAETFRSNSLRTESRADQRWHTALTALILGPKLANRATVDGAILYMLLGQAFSDRWHRTLPNPVATRIEPYLNPQSVSLGSTLLSVYAQDLSGLSEASAVTSNAFMSDGEAAFLRECNKLKDVFRATRLHDDSRRENTAEHSFHVALHAILLEDYAKEPVDLMHVIRMLLVHDIVEIDAGDTPIHAALDPKDQEERELAAANRLFGLLPKEKAEYLMSLWNEFEANETPSAQFAKSLDRVPPICANLANGGGTWVDYEVTYEQLVDRVGAKMSRGAPALWEYLDRKIREFPWFADQLK